MNSTYNYYLLEITVIYRFEFMDIVDVNMKQNEMPSTNHHN